MKVNGRFFPPHINHLIIQRHFTGNWYKQVIKRWRLTFYLYSKGLKSIFKLYYLTATEDLLMCFFSYSCWSISYFMLNFSLPLSTVEGFNNVLINCHIFKFGQTWIIVFFLGWKMWQINKISPDTTRYRA